LAQRVIERDAIGDVRFVFGVENCRREKTKVAGRPRNIERARKRNRFAGIDRLRARELFQIALDEIGNAQKDLRSFLARCFGPVGECILRRSHGKIDIFFPAVGNLRVRLAGRRLDIVEIFAADRLDELAIDVVTDSLKSFLHEIGKKLSSVAVRATTAIYLTAPELWRRGAAGDQRARIVLGIRILTAVLWFVFGTIFKVLGAIPRHREIVGQILGSDIAPSITLLIGIAETALGIWFLIGFLPRFCAVLQTLAIVSMNALELSYARSLLLAPIPMVILNSVLLALVWYAAIYSVENSDASSHRV
jgi:uncharacterized membrane protein YphA (DoxX/SURF4 family)